MEQAHRDRLHKTIQRIDIIYRTAHESPIKSYSLAEERRIRDQSDYFEKQAELRDHLNWQKEDFEKRLKMHRLFQSKREIQKQIQDRQEQERL